MEILAHRGWWASEQLKNSREAFHRSFAAGFGVETDLRDLSGTIVISHDMPVSAEAPITLDEFLAIYASYPGRPTLALNVKSDGLTAATGDALSRHGIDSYFTFDMSVPDTLHYLKAGLTVFTRRSEFETGSSLDARADGLWLDSFETDFVSTDMIEDAVHADKPFALVSPELHRKPHLAAWTAWRATLTELPARAADLAMLCTDIPDEAQDFFKNIGEERQ